MSQCNECCRTPCECMDGDDDAIDPCQSDSADRELYRRIAQLESERDELRRLAEAIAREVERLVREALEAERIRCTRQADRDAARRDAAYLDLRAQLDAVTAQRDELREAATDFVSRVSNVVPVDTFGHRKTSLQRLRAALESAR